MIVVDIIMGAADKGYWDLGRAVCEKHDLVTDFANHGKLKRLECVEEIE